MLNLISYEMNIEGHTDDISGYGSKYGSSMGLSAARAISVVNFLAENGVSMERMTAVGRGANKPRTVNETESGRAENRRVEIVILCSKPGQYKQFHQPRLINAVEAE